MRHYDVVLIRSLYDRVRIEFAFETEFFPIVNFYIPVSGKNIGRDVQILRYFPSVKSTDLWKRQEIRIYIKKSYFYNPKNSNKWMFQMRKLNNWKVIYWKKSVALIGILIVNGQMKIFWMNLLYNSIISKIARILILSKSSGLFIFKNFFHVHFYQYRLTLIT